MKKCVKQLRTSKYIIGLNGASTYIYDLGENLIKTLKDIKSVYNAYVSKDEKVLCLKSTDTYLAFYDLDTLELINKISFKKCHQPQDQECVFDKNNNLINLQYTDRLTTDLVFYNNKDYTEKQRFIYNNNIVLECIDVAEEDIYIVGFMRPDKEDFSINEIKRYIFKCENGDLKGYEIANKDYFCYSNLRNGLYSIERASDVEYMKSILGFTEEEIKEIDFKHLNQLWNKYNNGNEVVVEKPIN